MIHFVIHILIGEQLKLCVEKHNSLKKKYHRKKMQMHLRNSIYFILKLLNLALYTVYIVGALSSNYTIIITYWGNHQKLQF